ncbi:hypothetical protein ACRALDRAFT_2085142, partial [Sodiomyces alcalophilus JCM 7366]|uniref:uncharacterized protein n=1 Tax=Sodiomyces alcalophilus JCM 7366 TaxID=591952 RepID=UPI0039B58BDA
GPQQFRDPVVQSRIHHERDQFIASIAEEHVCNLASSYRNDEPCRFFREPARGSYNICYF